MRARARDTNEKLIVEVFRRAGKMVHRNYEAGITDLTVITPSPDLPLFVIETVDQALDIIHANEPISLVEIKTPGGKLTPVQQLWHRAALGGYGY